MEEHKKKQEIEFQNYCTTNPTDFAKAKREASDISDQSSKVCNVEHDLESLTRHMLKRSFMLCIEIQALCGTEDACKGEYQRNEIVDLFFHQKGKIKPR